MAGIRNYNILGIVTNGMLFAFTFVALLIMIFLMFEGGLHWGIAVALVPLLVVLIFYILKNPFFCFVVLLIANYFIIPMIRYSQVGGLSVLSDVLIALCFLSLFLRLFVFRKENNGHKRETYGLLLVSLIWFAYCGLELLNSSAMVNAWFLSRGFISYLFLISSLTLLIIKDFKTVEKLLIILSVLTLIGIFKTLGQSIFGFDPVESRVLREELAKTHLLRDGVRYFSIYASAGILGALMGHAVVVFGIIALYVQKRSLKIYFIIIALLAVYCLLLSGTRGAMAVPGAGFILFIFLSKRAKIIVPMVIFCLAAYIFLAHTTIGHERYMIRRMRTMFDKNEPSLMVRLENQKVLGEYLKNRPFGEGLGLSGVEAQSISERFTTSIPTDSWYVKIWVETGIVGLTLYLSIWIYIMVHASYIVLFKIKDKLIHGVSSALLCGVFGILVCSYGNLVLGQFPVAMIVYFSITLVFMGPYFDRKKRLVGEC